MDTSFLDRCVGDGGCWNVMLRTRRPLTLSANPIDSTMRWTLSAKYGQIGIPDDMDPPGRRLNYSMPYSIGIVRGIVVRDNAMEFSVLSRNELAAQSLGDIWRRELHPHLRRDTQTRPSLSGQNRLFWWMETMGEFGGHGQRNQGGLALAAYPQKNLGTGGDGDFPPLQ